MNAVAGMTGKMSSGEERWGNMSSVLEHARKMSSGEASSRAETAHALEQEVRALLFVNNCVMDIGRIGARLGHQCTRLKLGKFGQWISTLQGIVKRDQHVELNSAKVFNTSVPSESKIRTNVQGEAGKRSKNDPGTTVQDEIGKGTKNDPGTIVQDEAAKRRKNVPGGKMWTPPSQHFYEAPQQYWAASAGYKYGQCPNYGKGFGYWYGLGPPHIAYPMQAYPTYGSHYGQQAYQQPPPMMSGTTLPGMTPESNRSKRSVSRSRSSRRQARCRSRSRDSSYNSSYSCSDCSPPPGDVTNDEGSACTVIADSGHIGIVTTCGEHGVEIQSWLLNLDAGRGACLDYLEALQREFGELHQLIACAVTKPDADSVVDRIDPSVYETLGVRSLGHKLLLARGICATSNTNDSQEDDHDQDQGCIQQLGAVQTKQFLLAKGMDVEELLAQVPRNDFGYPTSIGSIGHYTQRCKEVCPFIHRPKGCANGIYCNCCHFSHGVRKRKVKDGKSQRDRYRQLKEDMMHQIEAAPNDFQFDSSRLPDFIANDERLKGKLMNSLKLHQDEVKKKLVEL